MKPVVPARRQRAERMSPHKGDHTAATLLQNMVGALIGRMKAMFTASSYSEARSLTAALVLCAATRMCVVDQRTVMSCSMQPALAFGDRVLVDKASVILGKLPGRPPGLGLCRGDIVIFSPPEASRNIYAELLRSASGVTAATPNPVGDKRKGHILSLTRAWERRCERRRSPLNSSLDFTKRVVALAGDRVAVRRGVLYVNESPADERQRSGRASYSFGPTVVPKDHIIVLGDNRDASFDSHVWGPLPVRNVIGCARARYWPVNRAAWLKRGAYLDR